MHCLLYTTYNTPFTYTPLAMNYCMHYLLCTTYSALLTRCYSLYTTYYTLLTTVCATYYTLLTIHYLLCATHHTYIHACMHSFFYLPLTTDYLLLTAHRVCMYGVLLQMDYSLLLLEQHEQRAHLHTQHCHSRPTVLLRAPLCSPVPPVLGLPRHALPMFLSVHG